MRVMPGCVPRFDLKITLTLHDPQSTLRCLTFSIMEVSSYEIRIDEHFQLGLAVDWLT